MKTAKKLLCIMITLLTLLLPFTANATEAQPSDTPQPFSFTLECFVGGIVPKDAEFVFSVTVGDYEWDTVENLKPTDNFVISTKDNPDGRKAYAFPDTVKNGGVYYSFKMLSTTAKLAIVDPCEYHVYFAETAVKVERIENGLPVDNFVDEPVVASFNCQKATEVKISDAEKITKVYDGKPQTAVTEKNYKLTGIVEGHDVKLTFDKAEFNSPNVKDAKTVTVSGLKLTGADAAKYGIASDTVELKGEITPRPLTVTADPIVMTAGQPDPKLTYTLSEELIEGNTPLGTLARDEGSAIGEYKITRGTLSFGDNYEITFIEGKLTVSNYSLAEIRDPATDIRVSGHFDTSATLKVSALDPQSKIYSVLAAGTSWGKIVSAYDITFEGSGVDGTLSVKFPVGEKYNGKEFAVYQYATDGTVNCSKAVAENGTVTVLTENCTQFMLATAKDKSANKTPVWKIILKVLLIIIIVIVSLAILLTLFFFGMIYFNRTKELKKIIRFVKRLLKKNK